MSKPVIQLDNVGFAIAGKCILAGVSATVAAGEFVSIIGPNGAGKTTLLKCLNRILPGASGRIAVAGAPLASYTQAQLARQIAYVPQAEGRQVDFTVFEFVMLGRYPHLSPFSSIRLDDERVVWEALQATDMAAFADRLLDTLSGGERQKAFIAAALAQQAPILVLDEPTSFLDPHHQDEILGLLRRLNRDAGVTIVSVTHDLNGAALVSDRLLGLRDGRVVLDGPPAAVMTRAGLAQVYEADFLFAQHPLSGQPMVVPSGGIDS